MKYRHVLFLLAFVGWLSSGWSRLVAQETPLLPLTLSSEETARPSSEPPTPQFLQVAVEIGTGVVTVRVPYSPAWLAAQRPRVRLGSVRVPPPGETDTAPVLEGGADQLYQALAQALNRAQPPAAPSP